MNREDHGTHTLADAGAWSHAHTEPADHPDRDQPADGPTLTTEERAQLVHQIAFWQAGAA